MRRLQILALIYLLTACKGLPEKKVGQDITADEKPALVDSQRITTSAPQKASVEKNNLLKDLLDFPDLGTDISKVPLTDFEVVKTPEQNRHDLRVTDTIYYYKNKAAEFRIYKATDKYILYHFNIYGSSFRLKNGIQIGMPQSELIKRLQLTAPLSDTISVEDSEGFSTVNFAFKDSKLSRIDYDGYLD